MTDLFFYLELFLILFDFDSILCWFLFCSIFNTIIPKPKCCVLLINNLINRVKTAIGSDAGLKKNTPNLLMPINRPILLSTLKYNWITLFK